MIWGRLGFAAGLEWVAEVLSEGAALSWLGQGEICARGVQRFACNGALVLHLVEPLLITFRVLRV